MPNTSNPIITISYFLLDATPEIIEQEATAPLENNLSQLSNVKKIHSISSQNTGSIEIIFDENVDIDFKKFEISSLIRQLYPKLHPQLSYPSIEQRGRFAQRKNPLLTYRINAKLAPFQIKRTAQDVLVPSLSRLIGIKEIILNGAEDLQITIDIDNEKLKSYNKSRDDIIRSIKESFSTFYPGTTISASGQKFTLKAGNQYYNIDNLKNLLLARQKSEIRLKDVAYIYIEETKPTQYYRINGLNSITLSIYGDENINRISVTKNVKLQVDKLSNNLPAGYNLQLDHDDTEFLNSEIKKNYIRAFLSISILTLFIAVVYRNWKHLIILFSGVFINLCITGLVSYLFEVKIHLYTIAGITISFGLLMDNVIMMLDQLHSNNSSKIFKAILAATLMTVMALILLWLAPVDETQDLREFSLIISIALCCSILISALYIPAIYSILLGTHQSNRTSISSLRKTGKIIKTYYKFIFLIGQYRKTLIIFTVLTFGLPIFLLPSQIKDNHFYNETIGNAIYQDGIRPYTDKILGGSLRLFIKNVYERSGNRDPERTLLYINAVLPIGNTINDMNYIIQKLEDYLSGVVGIEKYIAQIYSGQEGSITVYFNEDVENIVPIQIKNKIIARCLDWSGVEWEVSGIGRGFSNTVNDELPSFRVQLKGYNHDELDRQTERLADKLLKHDRIKHVNTNERLGWQESQTRYYKLKLDEEKVSRAGLSVNDLVTSLRERSEEKAPSLILNNKKDNFPVYIKSKDASLLTTYSILNDKTTIDNKTAKLSNIGSISLNVSSNSINKINREYIRVLGFEYLGSNVSASKFLDNALAQLEQELPAGFTSERISTRHEWGKKMNFFLAVIVLVIGIYFIGAILFENLKLPLCIIFIAPVSFVGVFIIFSSFDLYFDQGGYAALILLIALGVNSSVFILTDFNNATSKNRKRAIIKSTLLKLKPITISIVSTCIGLMPFALTSRNEVFWFPLAIGTISGLLFSLISIVVLLPVFSTNWKK